MHGPNSPLRYPLAVAIEFPCKQARLRWGTAAAGTLYMVYSTHRDSLMSVFPSCNNFTFKSKTRIEKGEYPEGESQTQDITDNNTTFHTVIK